MRIFDRRPALRWAVPATAGALIVGGALLGPLAASADSGLPPRTAVELLVDLQGLEPTPLSGTVSTRAELGLPELPMGSMPGSGPMALASGEGTVRVWYDGPERQRVALVETRSETTMVRDGREVWVWSSADATADRYLLPDGEADAEDLSELPPGVDLPSTPQEAAQMALEALDPTTEVTTAGVARVAGRDAYELILTPRDSATLVERVSIALDAETSVPLSVRIDSTTLTDPALEVGFTSVEFGEPDPALFEFTPPPGATVTEHPPIEAPQGEWAEWDATGDESAQPTVVGQGWSTVVIAELPAQALADLAEDGMRADEDERWGSDDPAATALALLEALPRTSGDWGSGRVLAGTLFSVILTDDGRVAGGLVGPEAVAAALSAQ
jgi:outer membrane lipoprotein-sorting protein